MANKDASFGLKPAKMMGGAPYSGGQSRYRIAANYGTSIFQGDLVKQVTGGGVERAAASSTVPVVGVFNGCMYTDPTTSEQIFSNFYSHITLILSKMQRSEMEFDSAGSLWVEYLMFLDLFNNFFENSGPYAGLLLPDHFQGRIPGRRPISIAPAPI